MTDRINFIATPPDQEKCTLSVIEALRYKVPQDSKIKDLHKRINSFIESIAHCLPSSLEPLPLNSFLIMKKIMIELDSNKEMFTKEESSGIDNIKKSLDKLDQLMRDLSTLVIEEGDVLDKVEVGNIKTRPNSPLTQATVRTHSLNPFYPHNCCDSCILI